MFLSLYFGYLNFVDKKEKHTHACLSVGKSSGVAYFFPIPSYHDILCHIKIQLRGFLP